MADFKPSPLIMTCLSGILSMGFYGAWDYAHKLELYIGSLPIKGAQTAVQAKIENSEKASSLAVLYPLYVESKQKAELTKHTAAEESSLIDSTFIRAPGAAGPAGAVSSSSAPDIAPPVAPKAPDYFSLLQREISVDALMQNGAVLSGTFYATGSPLKAFAYPAKNGQGLTTPVLAAVSAAGVLLKESAAEGKRSLVVSVPVSKRLY